VSAGAARAPLSLLWILLLLTAAPVHARSERPALHWVRGSGAHSCIDPRSLARRVEDITGPALVAAAQADVSIEAGIEAAQPGSYTLRMRVVSASDADSGERSLQLTTTDCRTLDATIAFLIATAVDPTLGADGVPEELSWVDNAEPEASADNLRRELSAKPASVSATSAAVPATPEHPPVSSAPRLWQLGAAAMGGNGPDARFAAGLIVGLAYAVTPRLTLLAQLSGGSAVSARELDANRSVLTQRVSAALFACLRLPLALRGCAGPELGALRAHGSGFASNQSTLVSAGGGVVRVDIQHSLDERWRRTAGLLLHAELMRPRIYYKRADDSFEAFRATAWLLQAALGVAYAF
jgi:hypothetical protein